MSTGTNSREMATLDPATIGQPEWHVRFSFILLGIARIRAVHLLKKNPHLSKIKVNLTRLVAGVDGERAHSCGQSSEKKSTSIENWGQSNVIGGWRGFSLSRARENRAACLFRNIPGLFEIERKLRVLRKKTLSDQTNFRQFSDSWPLHVSVHFVQSCGNFVGN